VRPSRRQPSAGQQGLPRWVLLANGHVRR
jgi:hypothetical protein